MADGDATLAVIRLDARAPLQPAPGAPCNGCGVCCALEPCPLGRVLSGRRHGTCAALVWDGSSVVYRCGALTQPRAALRLRVPALLATLLAPLLRAWARRAIAAGAGCDCPSRALPR